MPLFRTFLFYLLNKKWNEIKKRTKRNNTSCTVIGKVSFYVKLRINTPTQKDYLLKISYLTLINKSNLRHLSKIEKFKSNKTVILSLVK